MLTTSDTMRVEGGETSWLGDSDDTSAGRRKLSLRGTAIPDGG